MNSREKATLIWLAVVLVCCLLNREVRQGLWGVADAFFTPKVVGPIVALAAWTLGLCAVAHMVGLWETDVRKDTVVWFITVGIAFFFSLDRVSESGFFGRTARRAIAAAVFAEAFINLATLPLLAEIALLPVAGFFAAMAAFSEGKEEYAPAHRVANGLLGVIGAGLLLYGVVRLVGDFDAGHTARALLLPVWLTLGVMPFIYLVGLWSAYESAFSLIDLRTQERAQRRRAKRTLRRTVGWNAAELAGFAGHWIPDLARAESDEAARIVMDRWRATWRAERHANRLRDAREHMNDWFAQTEPVHQDLYADVVRSAWERLDETQRATLKAEGARTVPPRLVDDFHALLD